MAVEIPAGSVKLGHLFVLEYMDPDGNICMAVESIDAAEEPLSFGKSLEFIEFARMDACAPQLAWMVAQFCAEDLGDDAS